MFADAGYASVSPGWPDDPDTVAEAIADPDVFARQDRRINGHQPEQAA